MKTVWLTLDNHCAVALGWARKQERNSLGEKNKKWHLKKLCRLTPLRVIRAINEKGRKREKCFAKQKGRGNAYTLGAHWSQVLESEGPPKKGTREPRRGLGKSIQHNGKKVAPNVSGLKGGW